MTVALQAPERVQSLYLVEPGCPGVLDEQGLAAFMTDAGAMFGPVFGQVEAGQLQEAVATLIDGSGGRPGYFAAQPLKWQQAQLAEAASLPKQLSQSERPDWSPSRLAGFGLPICIVQGAQIRAFFAQVCEALGNAIPACQRLQVADVGHLYPIEQPALFVQQLQCWLAAQG
ncbi:alpha/beta fold hydrolase [Aeromonas hydrophila]|uniref:alpha/beta fold hydrolase n=1 Tax=Aeromonas hydrophila TaxID=644 RepID=UPI001EFEBB7C|nr:alpha/beta hydrolase [Aeromonas hydrophila]